MSSRRTAPRVDPPVARYRLRNADGYYALGDGITNDRASANVRTAGEWIAYLMYRWSLEPVRAPRPPRRRP